MKYTLVMRGHPRYPERGKKAYACAQYDVCRRKPWRQTWKDGIRKRNNDKYEYFRVIRKAERQL